LVGLTWHKERHLTFIAEKRFHWQKGVGKYGIWRFLDDYFKSSILKKQNKSPSVSPHVMKWASKRANAY